MGKFIDLTGQRFGRLTVLAREDSTGREAFWLCLCDCGNKKVFRSDHLRSKATQSCGCLNKHGMAGSKIYHVWVAMIQRCTNPNRRDYKHYGGRGIEVCKRWLKFETFYKDMGSPPVGLTLERLDNEKGYFPDNCTYATMKNQCNNSRKNTMIKYDELELTMKQWAERIKINYSTLKGRIRRKWPIEKALTQRVRFRRS